MNGEWVFSYELPLGKRCHKRGYSITTYGENSWFHPTNRIWSKSTKGPCSTHTPCKSFKAFKRHLRKHPELQGQEVVFVSRYHGCDITANYVPYKTIYSAIRTPDGTLLESRYPRSYKTHMDTISYEVCMIDGGTDYLRCSVNKVPFERIVFHENSPIEEVREYWSWGSYGKNGDEDLHYILLKDLTNNHIEKIKFSLKEWLIPISEGQTRTLNLLRKELNYRKRRNK